MGRIWIVNPFDPLPGDPEQPGRYATLARLLRDAGHDVTWWTSSFSHRFKKAVAQGPIFEACRTERIHVRFIETPPYQRNVSLRRVRAHHIYAEQFERQARMTAPPAVIIASNPPPESAAAAARVARFHGSRLVVDVQDIWVDNFKRFLPGAVRWAWPVLLRRWIQANRVSYQAADAVVGVAGAYADEPVKYGRCDYERHVIPLGIDLACFDEATGRGRSLLGGRQPDEIRIVYSGSFSRGYDVITLAEAAARLAPAHPNLRFIFSGRGEMEGRVRRILKDVPGVTFLGFAPFVHWAATLVDCDVGVNAVRPELLIFFPNKIFYYWAAGLAVLNSIPGECAEIVDETGTGGSYVAGDVDSACEALTNLISDRARLNEQKQAARRVSVERWDRRKLYQSYVELVGRLAG